MSCGTWYGPCCKSAGLEHIAPHDLRRRCAKLSHGSGGELEQIQFLLGPASVQTTERYLACKQNLGHPVNDLLRSEQKRHPKLVTVNIHLRPSRRPWKRRRNKAYNDRTEVQTMPNLSQSTISGNPNRHDMVWSRSEKAVARRAFDAVLKRELQEVMQEAKQMASKIKEASDLWELEQYLTRRRKEIDRKYDSRSSHLTHVFGRLLHEGRLAEEELRGLREDKLASIRSYAAFLAESDAA